ncbi:MAG: hypothetical protein JRI55_20090, partial [Deltaproteobacteria bacterium]|nr:hypothetical protein [Deltaproteobacteria bacterium]
AFAKHEPSFEFLCVEPYPRRGVTRLQAQVAKGKWGSGRTTGGMKEWASLGWYELAAYALLRGRCCSKPERFIWTFDLVCPFDEALNKIESSARAGDLPGIEAALEAYQRAANCLARRGQGPSFGQKRMPGSGIGAFRRMLDRWKQPETP